MAESEIASETSRASVLYKYPGNSSQDDLTNVEFPRNILPITSISASEDMTDDLTFTNILPNNNVVYGDGSVDCLNEGGCASNTSITSKISSVTSCGLETDSDDHKNIKSEAGYRLEKKLIVKLEAPTFSSKIKSSLNTNKLDLITDIKEKSVKFSDIVDVNNGVAKKRKKNKQDSLTVTKTAIGYKRQQRIGSGRGRPPKKPAIATYHSQISGDKNTIKIRIRKAHLGSQITAPVKKSRQRRKQKRVEISDTDASDYEENNKRLKSESSNQNRSGSDPISASPQEQSVWGQDLPKEFLHKVFEYLCIEEGSLPLLVNLCKICKLWSSVAISSSLWKNIDLSNCVNDRSKTDFRLQWLIQNRLHVCQDLNLSDWKIQNIPIILQELCEKCPELRGLNLSGWSGLTAENLKYLTSECSKLERLDLSAVNVTNQGTKSALNAAPLVSLAQTMGSRLTHLILAHNKLAGFSQILNGISAHCSNLQLLDLSNIKTHAYNSSLLHVEKLQTGCPKLRVLRVTNSQILLAPTSLTTQMASPGFPELEELSLAGIEDDQTTSKFIDDNGIERILKSSHKLRLLDVRGCTKITDSGLVKVPAWDLEHLFLSACYVTRLNHSGLELILQKWSHSLVEIDLAWSTATAPLDAAVMILAEKGKEAPIRTLDLCGSSVSLDSVKAVLEKCPHIQSINLQSCRALPRGIKRLYEGLAVAELCTQLQNKSKTEELESAESEGHAESSEEKLVSENDKN